MKVGAEIVITNAIGTPAAARCEALRVGDRLVLERQTVDGAREPFGGWIVDSREITSDTVQIVLRKAELEERR